jgi:hypothetical protein
MLRKLALGIGAALSVGAFGCAGPQSSLRPTAAAGEVSQAGNSGNAGSARDREGFAGAVGFSGGGEMSDSQDPIPIVPSPISPSDASFGRWPGDGVGGHWGGGNPVASGKR